MKQTDNVIDLQESAGGVIINPSVVVPDGLYELSYRYYRTSTFMDQPKVEVHFGITYPEEFAGLPLVRYYNVDSLNGRQKPYGDFDVGGLRDLAVEYRQILGSIGRLDRVSLCGYRNVPILGRTRTVSHGRRRRELSESCRYSIVAELISAMGPDDRERCG